MGEVQLQTVRVAYPEILSLDKHCLEAHVFDEWTQE